MKFPEQKPLYLEVHSPDGVHEYQVRTAQVDRRHDALVTVLTVHLAHGGSELLREYLGWVLHVHSDAFGFHNIPAIVTSIAQNVITFHIRDEHLQGPAMNDDFCLKSPYVGTSTIGRAENGSEPPRNNPNNVFSLAAVRQALEDRYANVLEEAGDIYVEVEGLLEDIDLVDTLLTGTSFPVDLNDKQSAYSHLKRKAEHIERILNRIDLIEGDIYHDADGQVARLLDL